MSFDLASAKPVSFDLSTAKPVTNEVSNQSNEKWQSFPILRGNQHSNFAQIVRDIPVGAVQGITGLADLVTMPGRALGKGFDAIGHKLGLTTKADIEKRLGIPTSESWFPLTNAIGEADQQYLATPANTPQTPIQRVGSGVTRALSGAATTMGAGAAISGPTSFLAANPALQLTSAAMGSSASGITREMGGGKAAQIIAGILASLTPGAAKFAAERIIGEPNAAGRTLLNKGADLTPGQQKAGSAYSQIEDASTHLPLVGSSFQKAKDAAEQQAKEAFILDAVAPGAKVPPTGDLKQTLSNVGDTFGPAYDAVSGFPLKLQGGKPVIVNAGQNTPLGTAFARAVSNKGILATDETRRSAADFLQNLLTLPIKNSEDLIAMRSAIRSEATSLSADQSLAARSLSKILDGAETQVTKALESQLPPNLMKNLQAVDAQYAKYKVAIDAMAKAKDRPTGFTWNEASQAAKTSAQGALGKDAYAKGEGFMREIPAAASEAFKTRPPTGASLTAQAAAYPLLPVTAFLSLTKTGRNLAATNQLATMNYAPAAITNTLRQPWEQD